MRGVSVNVQTGNITEFETLPVEVILTAADYEAAVDAHIDATAQAKGYDSRITCALRAGYTNPWQAEGAAFGQWMDSCYAHCYQVLADVQAQTRATPTPEELIAELPVMAWPA